jgi:hypothetical protein
VTNNRSWSGRSRRGSASPSRSRRSEDVARRLVREAAGSPFFLETAGLSDADLRARSGEWITLLRDRVRRASQVECPRCQQGWLSEVRLVNLPRDVVLCFECDAMWLDREGVSFETFVDYGTWMKAQRRVEPERPSEIEVLGFFRRR